MINQDAVLGVEGASLDIPIEQIPYAKVPVPYSDQLVLPQPSRGLIHPDDAPPVLANLNAMPSSGALQAEELHSTDHALNVNMVGGGGGSGGNGWQSQYPCLGAVEAAGSGTIDQVFNLGHGILYGFSCGIWIKSPSGSSSQSFFLMLYGGDVVGAVYLVHVVIPPSVGTSTTPYLQSFVGTFDGGLAVCGPPGPGKTGSIHCNAGLGSSQGVSFSVLRG